MMKQGMSHALRQTRSDFLALRIVIGERMRSLRGKLRNCEDRNEILMNSNEHSLRDISTQIFLLKRSLRTRRHECLMLRQELNQAEMEVTYLESSKPEYLQIEHPSGELFLPVSEEKSPLGVTPETLLLAMKPKRPQTRGSCLAALCEVPEPAAARGGLKIPVFLLSTVRICMNRIMEVLRFAFESIMRHFLSSKIGSLTLFVEFIRKLRIRSARCAWERITHFPHEKNVETSEIPIVTFSKAIRELGFNGDPVLIASKIDWRRSGKIKYFDFIRAIGASC